MVATPVAESAAHVAEHHGHDVHRGAQVVGDARGAAGSPGRACPARSGTPPRSPAAAAPAGRPGTRGRTARCTMLPEAPGDGTGGRRRPEVGVVLHLPAGAPLGQHLLERLVADVQHHGAVHLDEPPVRVPGEARVAGERRQALHRLGVQADVEDGVHHPRHGELGARAAGDEQRVRRVAEPLARSAPRARAARRPRRPRAPSATLPDREIGAAGLGGDGEAGRHRQPEPGHLREVGALAAEEGLDLVPGLRRPLHLGQLIEPEHQPAATGRAPRTGGPRRGPAGAGGPDAANGGGGHRRMPPVGVCATAFARRGAVSRKRCAPAGPGELPDARCLREPRQEPPGSL